MKIYFAGPLFSEAERNWIRSAIKRIEALAIELDIPVDVLWPFELISNEEIEELGDEARCEVFERCRSHLVDTDVLVAILDGSQVDDGTAWEMGYYYAIRPEGSWIVGIRTDYRYAGEFKNSLVNAMIECSCDRIALSIDQFVDTLREIFTGES